MKINKDCYVWLGFHSRWNNAFIHILTKKRTIHFELKWVYQHFIIKE
jgi:hypothetical protein